MKGMIEKEEHMDALGTAEEYTKCFPDMDTAALIFLRADGWEQLCVRNDYLKSKAIKKIVLLVADSKTEPEVMEAAEAKKAEAVRLCERGNLKLYKMRALKQVWEKSVEGAGEGAGDEGGEEKQ